MKVQITDEATAQTGIMYVSREAQAALIVRADNPTVLQQLEGVAVSEGVPNILLLVTYPIPIAIRPNLEQRYEEGGFRVLVRK